MSSVSFFVACIPPTSNHQRKRIVRVGRYARLADKPELVAAKAMLDAVLLPHQPLMPVFGPVRVEVEVTWPWRQSEPRKRRLLGRAPHTSRPDASNIYKTLEDRLVALRFIGDDANVCEVTVRKWWGDEAGIRVTITPIAAAGAAQEVA